MSQFLIADDHPLFREALKGALTKQFEPLEVLESDTFDTTLAVLDKHDDLDILLLICICRAMATCTALSVFVKIIPIYP